MEEIESNNSLKVYASVWEVNTNGEIVYTKDGKVVLNKEPSATLLRIMDNQLSDKIFMLVQRGTSQSLADAHKLACARVFSEMNEDRSFYESRGSRKKVKGDLENDAPQKLADLSLMWEKMTGSNWNNFGMQRSQTHCNGKRCIDVKESKSYRNSEHQEKGTHKVLYQILWQLCPRRLQG